MDRVAVRLLRVALAIVLLGSVLAQLLVPVFASESGTVHPEVGYLVVPYSVAGVLVIACGQVALLVVWRLLTLVSRGVIFTRRALRWVDVITACGLVATVLSAGVLVHLIVVVGVSHPVVTLGLVASLAGGAAFVLLMIVMRGLLESAITDRAELEEVI